MTRAFWWRAWAMCAGLVLLVFAVGWLRDTVLAPRMDAPAAGWVARGALLVLWAVAIGVFLRSERDRYRRAHLPWLGLGWGAVAIAVEWVLWSVARGDGQGLRALYGYWHGPGWVLLPVALYVLPLLLGRLLKPARLGPAGHELRER